MIYPIWFANYQPYSLGIKLSMIFSSTLNDQKIVNEKSGASVGPHTEDSKLEKKSTLAVCKKNHNCSGPSFCNLGDKKTESRRIRYNAARSLHQSQIISLTIWSWLLTNFDLCLCICLLLVAGQVSRGGDSDWLGGGTVSIRRRKLLMRSTTFGLWIN